MGFSDIRAYFARRQVGESFSHTVRKNVAKASASIRGMTPGTEFQDYKKRIQIVKKDASYLDRKMEVALKDWRVLIIDQRNFATRLYDGCPRNDAEIVQQAKIFKEGSDRLYDKCIIELETSTPEFASFHHDLKSYIRKIKDVEKMYGEVILSKSLSEKHQSRLDAIDRKRTGYAEVEEEKRTRTIEKMEQQRERHERLREETIEKQKEIFESASDVYKKAICAYWNIHEHHADAMREIMATKSLSVARSATYGS